MTDRQIDLIEEEKIVLTHPFNHRPLPLNEKNEKKSLDLLQTFPYQNNNGHPNDMGNNAQTEYLL